MPDQIENFRMAIRKKKARIEEINFICSQPMRPGVNGGSRRRLIEERLHLEQAVEELETEVRRLQFHEADRSFRWEDIDQRLLSAKTNALAEEMSQRIEKARRRIHFEAAQSGNSGSFTPRWFDFMEELAEERMQRLYEAYRKTWVQQNRVITPSFIRAVHDRVIVFALAGTKSSVIGRAARTARATNQTVNSTALGDWSRRIDRLAARWNRKLEAEAVAAGYAAARIQTNESELSHDSAVLGSLQNEDNPSLLTELPGEEDLRQPEETERSLAHREAVIKKIQNPEAYRFLTVADAALYFEVRPRTIYRWQLDGKLRDGGRRGSVTIESLRDWEKKRARKRRSA